ncbi:MAG: hypothetical protein RSB67_02685 [Clostridia bacterium]
MKKINSMCQKTSDFLVEARKTINLNNINDEKEIDKILENNEGINGYIAYLNDYCNKVEKATSGSENPTDTISFLESSKDEIKDIKLSFKDAFESKSLLHLLSLITDIYNNLSHTLKSAQNRNYSDEIKKLREVKKLGVENIINECNNGKEKNEYYGFKSDDLSDNKTFAVDIPLVGQICWHFPENMFLNNSKQYPLDIYIKRYDMPNKSFLKYKISKNEEKNFPKHIQEVLNSQDINEMNKKLQKTYENTGFMKELKNQTYTNEQVKIRSNVDLNLKNKEEKNYESIK